MSLDLAAVRHMATQEGLEEIYINPSSAVVSFAPHSIRGGDLQHQQRVNVYYTTGTVGTCIEHPRQGKTQMFRRNVSLELLREIFRDPRIHTGLGYKRKMSVAGSSAPVDEEAEARAELVRLDDEAKRIEEQRTEVKAVIARFEQQRAMEAAKQHAEKEAARKAAEAAAREAAEAAAWEATRQARGNRMWARLDGDQDFVLDSCNTECGCISTNGAATIMLFDTRGTAWTSGLPKGLHNALNGRQSTLPRATCAAIGAERDWQGNPCRWFVQFADGSYRGSYPDSMDEHLEDARKAGRRVATVAFGGEYDTFFIVFTDGYWGYGGYLPSGLNEIIGKRQSRADLTAVSLGPDGEWFMSAKNGRWWTGSLPDDLNSTISEVGNFRVTFMDFGANGSWLLRYRD